MKLRTNIYLEQRQALALDEAARARGLSRAEVVREFIDAGLGGAPGAALESDLAAIEASFGVMGRDEYTPVRAPDDRARHLERLARG